MMQLSNEFVLSTEQECLTVFDQQRGDATFRRFFDVLRTLAPSLPAPSGIFNAYGRVYVDCGHIELAAAECASPYMLPQIVECQQRLVAQTVRKLKADGCALLVANNNHSGLLEADCPVWGAHENYLVERHPSEFGDLILPFLVTRIYGGAGGIEFPSGNFLAAVRPVRMELATGGGTTGSRAIHSTAREEHHMGGLRNRFRYHLILGDGHRSHFNTALQFAATALAIKAVFFDDMLPEELTRLGAFPPQVDWVHLLKRLNVLARAGEPLRVDPLVIATQRVYHAAARRYASRLTEEGRCRAWIPRALANWDQTLAAYETMDRLWLAARLDTFIKYEFYSAVLAERGLSWSEIANNKKLCSELALLDHSYHEFCNPESVFNQLEQAGALNHRVAEHVEPGSEAEPFVPETGTRATSRGRFLREHAGQDGLIVDWSRVDDLSGMRRLRIDNPLAERFDEWQPLPGDMALDPLAARLQRPLAQVEAAYDQGEYERAHHLLEEISLLAGRRTWGGQYLRLKTWVQARRGHTDAADWLIRQHDRPADLAAVNDYCTVFRFRGLVPSPQLEHWLDAGAPFLAGEEDSGAAATYYEHAGYWHLKQGRPKEARRLLELANENPRFEHAGKRIQARILATLGESYRVLTHRRRARRALRKAEERQRRHSFHGDLADMTYLSLAKWERRTSDARAWLAEARRIQESTGNAMGLAGTLLLEARLLADRDVADRNKRQLEELQTRIPALADCPLLGRILDVWKGWVDGAHARNTDAYWGV